MRAYVAVGTNLGDRWGHLRLAARELRSSPGVTLLRASRVYETAPLGPPQPRYLNAVLEIETVLAELPLFVVLQEIERTAHRRRAGRWGPRTLDLDMLLYEGRTLRTPGLTLPHPRLGARRFVLAPLAELRPELMVPGHGASVAELLAAAPPHEITLAGRYPT